MSEDVLDDPKVSRHDTPITSCLMIPRPHEPTKSIMQSLPPVISLLLSLSLLFQRRGKSEV
ncbi:hypothetical protein MUK42_02819 [Musa troglodytarum]|uniref:Uncharacterized protein n=1 Tax=Musa troglodytarum TaxID=320322 RepID=A0A9E7ETZ6_9LILI|nr:hypothetical protein MUK42_02819 [Musa troglodytarum]